jgi:rod shape determining protein RodA
MREQRSIFEGIDWVLVGIYLTLVLMGWLNIYAAVFNEEHKSIFDFTQNYGKQLIWIIAALVIAFFILAVDGNFFTIFAFPIYIIVLMLLVLVLGYSVATKGAHSWFEIGSYKFQPSEFAKFATSLALAKFLSTLNIRFEDMTTKIMAGIIVGVPAVLILLQNDTGSTLVFASFVFVLYREGLSGNILLFGLLAAILFVMALLVNKYILIGILGFISMVLYVFSRKKTKDLLIIGGFFIISAGSVFSVDYVFEKVLQPHQKDRIEVLLGKKSDPKGVGYNVNQSLIAIGSGGFFGKGYLNGTQTKFDFVPEQSTDFIFCTVGEEWGFLGSIVVLGLFVVLLFRIITTAERQRSQFTRIYGYCVACILFIHVGINVGMAIGVAPVIGIPLPFFSYGGSSLWAFTILLFIFVKLDAYRLQVLR